jgi:hypothetical protein
MCCTALEIPEFKKPAGPPCEHCIASGGCKIYASRRSSAATSNANG